MRKVVQVLIVLSEFVVTLGRFISIHLRGFAQSRGYTLPAEICCHELPTFVGEPDDLSSRQDSFILGGGEPHSGER